MLKPTHFVVTVDGCDYKVEVDGAPDYSGGNLVRVFDMKDNLIADAEKDDDTESVYFGYHDEGGCIEDREGASSDLYRQTPEEIANWLISTHPCN